MKYIRYYILLILSLGLVSACMIEEDSIDSSEGQLVHKVFTATFEESDMTTKTMLDGNVGDDGIRGLLWDPEDEIGVAQYSQSYQYFRNTVTSASSNGVFEGSIGQTSVYYAVYPYQSGMKHGTNINVTVPTVQTYRENSFDRNVAPMVGKGNDGEPLHFMNICGVLAVQLTGTEVVKSIVFETKNGEKVSGVCSVDTDYVEYPVLDATTAAETHVTLDCGEGVQLGSEAVPFHIVLPPGTYDGFTLYITTADGKFMEKTTSKALTIKRSIVTKAASFGFEENVTDVTDLSEHGHSNCYVVPEAGIYSFDADIIGNGEFGIIEGAGFHTTDPTISPVSVALLWEDRAGLIKSYALDQAEGKVKFMATSIEGNALIAVKDAEGTILWSWHIWMTDQPSEQNYENDVLGSFVMLDRNIGAIRADRGTGDEWEESIGLHYQWGRKDPFAQGTFTVNSTQMSAGDALKYPTTFINSTYWTSDNTVAYWNPEQKTVYDPCPVGYRVPAEDVWYGFTDNGNSQYVNENHVSSTTYDNGWSFYRSSDSETAWYPATGYYSGSTGKSSTSYGYLWSANKSGSSDYYMYFRNDGYIYQNQTTYPYYAYNVRCMKDENYIDISTYVSFKPVGFSDVGTSSVKVSSGYKAGSAVAIVEKGFAYDKSADFSNETRVAVESDGRNFLCTLTDLDNATRYYVRAYAETVIGNETVMFYSDAITVGTRYSDDVASLSENGTANCYIVSYPGTYSFNCTVKGNGTESVGAPASAAVIWETANLTEDISVGDIIVSAQLVNDVIVFDVPGKYGNAVIAVMDESETVLWSWHIWVTDYDPESTAQTYNSGAVMMDRNLGALNAERDDVLSWGLFYQQGRKDPFVGCGNITNKTFATTAPADKIQYMSGGDNDTSVKQPWMTLGSYDFTWSSDAKSMTDPCPLGWKVPSPSVWNGFSTSYRTTLTYGVLYCSPSSNPDAYYPYTGDTEMGTQYLRNSGNSNSYLWTTNSGYAYYFYRCYETSRSKYDENPVRCMKDDSNKTSESETYTESENYQW